MSIAELSAPIVKRDPNAKWLDNFESNRKHAIAYSKYTASCFGIPVYFDVLSGVNGPYIRGYVTTPFLYHPITVFRDENGNAAVSIQDFRDIGQPQVFGDNGELTAMADPKPWHYLRSAPLQRKGRGVLARTVKYRAAVRGGFAELFINWQVLGQELLRIALTDGETTEYGAVDHAAAGIAYVPQDQRVAGTTTAAENDEFFAD